MYNQWYEITYEPIFTMADWQNFNKDLERKLVAIFSWMPQTIMSIKHDKESMKCHHFGKTEFQSAIDSCQSHFDELKGLSLVSADLSVWEKPISEVCGILFPILGSVASSKYLHFSAPYFFPMWDRQIRIKAKFPDSPVGYVSFMQMFKDQMKLNFKEAKCKYPSNPVRGWDIVCMENRNLSGTRTNPEKTMAIS